LMLPKTEKEALVMTQAFAIGDEDLINAVQAIIRNIKDENLPLLDRFKKVFDTHKGLFEYLEKYNFYLFIDFASSPMPYSISEHGGSAPENKAIELMLDAGEYLQVSRVSFNGVEYRIDKVYRNISVGETGTQGRFVYDDAGMRKRYMVLTDTLEEDFKRVEKEFTMARIRGILTKKQWPNGPVKHQVIVGLSESVAIHEIIHDLFPRLGELPSMLAQLAFGPVPFEDLNNFISILQEAKGGSDFVENILFDEYRDILASEHYNASLKLVAYFLSFVLRENMIDSVSLRDRVSAYLLIEDGDVSLKGEKAGYDIEAVISALSSLSESEIREISKQWLKKDFGFEITSGLSSVSFVFPGAEKLVSLSGEDASRQEQKSAGIYSIMLPIQESNLLAGLNGRSRTVLVQSVEENLVKTGEIGHSVERAKAVQALAATVARIDMSAGEALVKERIPQRFIKGSALLSLAQAAFEQGDKKSAKRLLEESGIGLRYRAQGRAEKENVSLAETIGGVFFNLDELIGLQQKLGMSREAEETLDSLERYLLDNQGNVSRERAAYILKIAKWKGMFALESHNEALMSEVLELLKKIEKSAKSYSSSEAREPLLIDTAELLAQFNRKSGAKRILEWILKSEIGWVNAKSHAQAAAALGTIGYPEKSLKILLEIEAIKERRSNHVGVAADYLYILIASAFARVGNIEKSREYFAKAVSPETQAGRFESDSWGIVHTIEAQIEYPEFLADAVENTVKIRDFGVRAEWLLRIARVYREHGKIPESVSVLREARIIAENILDEAHRARTILDIKVMVYETDKQGNVFESDDRKEIPLSDGGAQFVPAGRDNGFIQFFVNGKPLILANRDKQGVYGRFEFRGSHTAIIILGDDAKNVGYVDYFIDTKNVEINHIEIDS
ncbi:MAG: hypothetical protein PHE58_07890, partial [Candidatus Omnitrophica bacterium]|nr:hypothetical protein [Candidatus Omnitrophota bacterium]